MEQDEKLKAKALAYLARFARLASKAKARNYSYLLNAVSLGASSKRTPSEQSSDGQSIASSLNVVADIHRCDYIYQFIADHPNYKDSALQYYLSTGRQSAVNLREIIRECHPNSPSVSILEFASGYGCVTRHFADVLPEATVTACDIHPAAVEFIANTIGVRSVHSAPVPERLALDGAFDVVFALSFFSHMPKSAPQKEPPSPKIWFLDLPDPLGLRRLQDPL